MTIILSHDALMNEQTENVTIQVAKLITILDETESPVATVPFKCALKTIKRIQTAMPTKPILTTRGVHVVCTNVSFRILVTKFPKEPIALHKHISTALGTDPPEILWNLKVATD